MPHEVQLEAYVVGLVVVLRGKNRLGLGIGLGHGCHGIGVDLFVAGIRIHGLVGRQGAIPGLDAAEQARAFHVDLGLQLVDWLCAGVLCKALDEKGAFAHLLGQLLGLRQAVQELLRLWGKQPFDKLLVGQAAVQGA